VITKALKGFPRSVQKVGILGDGSLYIDAHVFDDDYDDYADTDYLAAADVVRLREALGALGFKAGNDEELLEVLAERYSTAYDARTALKALGFQLVHRTDLGARCDVS
jgi:hypothetical protein